MPESAKEERQKNRNINHAPSRRRSTLLLAAGGYVNTAIVIVQGLLLMPLYLHYIGAHTYGLWLASGGMLAMLGLVNFGVGSMVIQRVASSYGNQDMAKAGIYFINGVVVYLGICLLVSMLGWLISIWLPNILKLSESEGVLIQQCFLLALAGMVVAVFNECLRGFSQALLRPVVPMAAMALGRTFGIVLSVWMLFDDFGLWAIPAGTVLSEVIILMVNVCYSSVLFRMLDAEIKVDKKVLKEYMHTSPALLGARAGQTLSQESEPLLITMFLAPEITAIYMITRKAADMVFLLLSVIYGSSHSSFSHLVGERDHEKTKNMALKLVLLVFVTSVVGFATYAGANQAFVSVWVGKDFVLDQSVILLLGMGFFVRALRGMIWQILNGLGEFVYSSGVIIAEGLIRIGLAVSALSMVGVIGIPFALLISCFFSFVLLALKLQAKLTMKIDLMFMFKAIVSFLILFGISAIMPVFFTGFEMWTSFALFVAVLFSFLVLSFGLINFKMCMTYSRKVTL